MSVWLVIPSKRPLAEANTCLEAWRERGYFTAVLREPSDGKTAASCQFDTLSYLGWPRSVNLLVATIMANVSDAEWFVGGGDDYVPDMNYHADEIADSLADHFSGTFGVCQPTGDRWEERNGEAVIDRIAGSPWLGRSFCRRMYHGSGPMYNGYYHNFADEELQNVAQKLGVFWQRRDLLQEHRHVARNDPNWQRHVPQWQLNINDPRFSDWDKSKALFAARKAAGFPGHEPLEL